MSTLGRACSSCLFVALAFVACGGHEPQPQPQSAPAATDNGAQASPFIARLCDTLCQKQVQCDPKWDVATCQKNCRERGSPARAFWREDYAKATLACLDAAGCDVMAKGDDTEKKCFGDTRPEPSAAAKRFCERAQEKEHTCSGAAPDVPGCLRTWGMMSEAALTDMTACQQAPCGKAPACVKSTVGFPRPTDG